MDSDAQTFHRRKTAYLFLVRDRLLNPRIWTEFFRHNWQRCSIYIHSKQPYREPQFSQYSLDVIVPTKWGFLLEAELHLLRTALTRSENDRFIFVSESCLPLRSFDAVEQAIRSTPNSLIQCCRMTRNHLRRRPRNFPKDYFKKQSQWMVLNLPHAQLMATDRLIAPMFLKSQIADEHYPISFLIYSGLCQEVSCRQTHFTDWSNRRRHPRTFSQVPSDRDLQMLAEARNCGTLFARKFPKNSELSWLLPWIRM